MENCLYTSASLHIWLRRKRKIRVFFIVAPLILGSLSTFELISRSNEAWAKAVASLAALLAGLMPSIYAAMKYDDELQQCKTVAAEFNILQHRFRHVAVFSSKKPLKEFEKDFKELVARMEIARAEGITAPEWCFKEAQKKVQANDYTFDVDLENRASDDLGRPESMS